MFEAHRMVECLRLWVMRGLWIKWRLGDPLPFYSGTGWRQNCTITFVVLQIALISISCLPAPPNKLEFCHLVNLAYRWIFSVSKRHHHHTYTSIKRVTKQLAVLVVRLSGWICITPPLIKELIDHSPFDSRPPSSISNSENARVLL